MKYKIIEIKKKNKEQGSELKNPTKSKNANKNVESKFKLVRILWITIGVFALVCGTIGIALPILPTVPFYLLTVFAFAKGSKKFHYWFLQTKIYKKYMVGFAKHKSMSLAGELFLLLSVSLFLILTMYLSNKLAVSIVLSILIALKYGYFVFKVKTVTKKEMIHLKSLEK